MNFNIYQKRVEGFMNPETIATPERRTTNALLGLSGEIGEVAEIYKKGWFHGREVDRDKVIKEAGDVLFYLAELSSAIGVTLEDVALINIDKLATRYPNGFTTADSIAKKDENN